MDFLKTTLDHTLMGLCHDTTASYDELTRRIGLFRDINPLGPDVSIQMHTYIFSTADGRLPLSAVSHLKNMVSRVVRLMDIGTAVNQILSTLQDNMSELNQIRSILSGVPVDELPVFPANDYTDRVTRTRKLLDAVRVSLTPDGNAESEPPATTVDVVNIFDHNRFFFTGVYPQPLALKDLGSVMGHLIKSRFSEHDIAAFVSSRRMDEIIATIECVVKFYTGLLEQLERTISFAKSMFDSYSVASTAPIVAAPTPANSLARSTRNFDHVQVEPGMLNALETPSTSSSAGAGAGNDDSDDESSEPGRKRKRTYRKRLPIPLGKEPEGATVMSPKGVKLYPKPHVLTMSGALLHVIEHYKVKDINGKLAGLIGRLPPTNIVRVRLEEFFQADMRDRYLPALAKILVNYSHDMKVKRVVDTEPKHQEYLRLLYLEEHQRVSNGGERPPFEELVGSKPDMTPLDTMFTLEELQENLLSLM